MSETPIGAWRRRTLLQSTLASVAASAFTLPSIAAEGPVQGGTLTFVVTPEPTSLTTVDNTFGANQRVATKVTEGLVAYDFNGKLLPQLALSWSISQDGLRYTFKLRPEVKWHDGQPFTAQDVAYSIAQIRERQSFGRSTFANLSSVEIPDPLTITLVLSQPSGFLLNSLHAAITPIIPKHVYENKDFATHPANLKPIGTGPFVFKEWVKGSHIILERNPNYWDAPKPYLDRIIVKFIADASARAFAIENGEVDLAADNPIPPSELARFAQLPGIEIEKRGYGFLGSQTQLELNLRNPILQKLEVREAIAHVLNIEEIKNKAWYGYAQISASPITVLDRQNHNPAIRPRKIDPARARQLLDRAGYPVKPDGNRFTLRLVYNPYNDGYRRVAEIVRQSLATIGIQARIIPNDFAGYVKTVYTDGAFDLNAATHVNLYDPSVGVQRIYWSKNIKQGVPFSNASHYNLSLIHI